MKKINIKYDLSLVYVNLEKGEITGEHVVETYRTMESLDEGIARRDLLDLYEEGRSVEEGEVKELLILEKEFNGKNWEEVKAMDIQLGGEDRLFNINQLYQLTLSERVKVYTDIELIELIRYNQLTEEVEVQIARDLGDEISLYNIWVDEEYWFTSTRDALINLNTTIPKKGLSKFYSLELLKVYKDKTFESNIIKEFHNKEEGLGFIKEAMDAFDYNENLESDGNIVLKGKSSVKDWLVVAVEVKEGENGFSGAVDKVLYIWEDEKGWVYNDEGVVIEEVLNGKEKE